MHELVILLNRSEAQYVPIMTNEIVISFWNDYFQCFASWSFKEKCEWFLIICVCAYDSYNIKQD